MSDSLRIGRPLHGLLSGNPLFGTPWLAPVVTLCENDSRWERKLSEEMMNVTAISLISVIRRVSSKESIETYCPHV